MKKLVTCAFSMILLFGGATSAFAATSEDYSAELDVLKKQVTEIEAKLKTADTNKTETDTKDKEKKTKANDTWNFDGDFRVRSIWNGGAATFAERVRLAVTEKASDTTSFYARWALMNNNQMGTTTRLNDSLLPTKTSVDPDMSSTDNNILSDAYMRIDKLFGTDNVLTIGRFGQDVGATGFWNSAGTYGLLDGVKVDTVSDNLETTVGFANWSPLMSSVTTSTSTVNAAPKTGSTAVPVTTTTTAVTRKISNAIFVNASYKVGENTAFYWAYVKATPSANTPINFQVSGPGISTRFNDDWSFKGDYLKNYAAVGNPLGEYFSLMYKGANDQKPHSYGLSLDYHYVQPNNIASTLGTGISMQPSSDIKGPGVTAHYSPAKYYMLDFYQTYNTRKASTGEKIANYSRLQLLYIF